MVVMLMPLSASAPMLVTLSGIVTETKFTESRNASAAMLVTGKLEPETVMLLGIDPVAT